MQLAGVNWRVSVTPRGLRRERVKWNPVLRNVSSFFIIFESSYVQSYAPPLYDCTASLVRCIAIQDILSFKADHYTAF